jgi:anti-sigma factor RsiW
MKVCRVIALGDLERHFYGELDRDATNDVAAHLAACSACRAHLDDLRLIREALVDTASVEAPPAGDWSGFMRRMDIHCGIGPTVRPSAAAETGWRHMAAAAATLAVIAGGVFFAAHQRVRQEQPAATTACVCLPPIVPSTSGVRALRAASAEHLDRSKLVVLDLAARDPRRTTSADWAPDRVRAAALLSDTRLFRLQAEDKGLTDVAHVMRDLETVLLETSMSDGADRDALPRVQHLITRRELVEKMQVVEAAGIAGL